MARFIQLGNSYRAQEFNWVKGGLLSYKPRGHVDSLEITRKYMMVRNISATDYNESLADLDFYDFDHFVLWLPKKQKEVFIAENLRIYITPGTGLKRFIAWDRKPWGLLNLSKHTYNRLLDEAVSSIKDRAGLV